MSATPYVNEDGDLWFKAKDVSLPEARSLAAEHARETLDEWGRARFVGKETTDVHEHEYWPESFPRECEENGCEPAQPCWHFRVYER